MWTSHMHQVRLWCSVIWLLVCIAASVTSAPYYYFSSHAPIVPVQPPPLYFLQSPHYIHQQQLEPVHSYAHPNVDDINTSVVYQKQYLSRGEPISKQNKPPSGPVRIFFLFSRFPWPIEPLLQRIQTYFSTYTVPTQEPLLAEEIDIAPDPELDELEPEINPGRPAPPEDEIQETSTNTEVLVTNIESHEETTDITTEKTTEKPTERPVITTVASNSIKTRSNKYKFPLILPNHSIIL